MLDSDGAFDGAEPLVELSGVRKSLPGFRMGPVDLTIEPGYVTAVVGPNGSGKSTLFRMLLDLLHPDAGDRVLFGRPYPGDELAIKRRIGYLPDVSAGHDEMRAEALGRFVGYWYPTWDASRFGEVLDRFAVDRGKRFGKLSKGMRRRVAFAATVAPEAPLLVLDEPTESIDLLARAVVFDEISRYVQDGRRSVVLATHVAGEVVHIADYVTFLYEGRFLGTYEKDELMQNWKALWVADPPGAELPGLVDVEVGELTRVVSRSSGETRAALEERGIGIVRTESLGIEEILDYLARLELAAAALAADSGACPATPESTTPGDAAGIAGTVTGEGRDRR